MISYTQKQIKGLLENLSKDTLRPALCNVYVDQESKNLVATDGYTMVVLPIDLDKDLGKGDHYILRKSLEDWTKLHKQKDTISSDELVDMVSTQDCRFPDYQYLLNMASKENESSQIDLDLTLLHRFEKVMPKAKVSIVASKALLTDINDSRIQGVICGLTR